MIYPYAQIHFQINLEKTRAVSFSALSSQLPGVIRVADTFLGFTPPILSNLLSRSFRLRTDMVEQIQESFAHSP
ncbi:hypothetical protein ZOSMA_102G00010 [Zostera marina]|uniref:Cupin type-1 domain-containing protein n=1 Tax=Zostera marina TaxID=29655 RepID=A0A0K9Q528_ZOSMR|nr:hypothetical protein ZOSMA_102G00010 [Zostera marina]